MFLVKEILPYAGQKNMLLGTMKNPHSRASSRTNRAFFGYQQIAFTALVFCAIFAPTGFAQAAGPKDAGLRRLRCCTFPRISMRRRTCRKCRSVATCK